MNRTAWRTCFIAAAAILAAAAPAVHAWDGGALIINHACSDLSRLPAQWADSAKAKMNLYNAHTSHGSQICAGLLQLESDNTFYSASCGANVLPKEPETFCVFDNNSGGPAQYWSTVSGMNSTRTVLSSNPEINASLFIWCVELNTYTEAQLQAYLDSICVLEAEFPEVTFIYCTGTAQYVGSNGYNRWLRNEQIREFCRANGKVLFDFADLDAWWRNPDTEIWEQATYRYNELDIPYQHPQFEGDDAGHTTIESCLQKARAMWWLAAMLSGWHADPSDSEESSWGGLKRRFGSGG